MARLHALGVALVAVVVLGTGTWGAVAHHDADVRDALAATRARDAFAVTSLALPTSFTPIPCAKGVADYDRCWRVAALPDTALDDIVSALGAAGVEKATPDCTRGRGGDAMGCTATAGTVAVVATHDVNEAWTPGQDVFVDTSTLAIAQF